ncbi:MAG: hypothetical protein R3B49_03565 [Phycisphaerales bacterium]
MTTEPAPRVVRPAPRNRARTRAFGELWLVVLWTVLVGASLVLLTAYAQHPGRSSGAPPHAAAVGLHTAPTGYTLVLAVRPHCSCTEVSLAELDRLLGACRGRLACRVLIARSGEDHGTLDPAPVLAILAQHPDVTWTWDDGGALAASLGCVHAGSVVLYDKEGTPVFWGCIAAEGDDAGEHTGADTIAAIVNAGDATPPPAPTLGG